jgi:hypothetical protein
LLSTSVAGFGYIHLEAEASLELSNVTILSSDRKIFSISPMLLRIRLQEHVFAGKTIGTSIIDGDDALYIYSRDP